MINVVSFSGGRTSAYLLWLMEQKRQAGEDVHYVFMDKQWKGLMTRREIEREVCLWGQQ